MAEFDQVFERFRKLEASRSLAAIDGSLHDPETTAANMDVARQLGLPAPVVDADPGSYAKQLRDKRNSSMLVTSDRIRGWMANPENAKIAVDDIENLSAFERIAKSFELGEARGVLLSKKFSKDTAATLETSWLGSLFNEAGEQFDRSLLTGADGKPNILGRVANAFRSSAMRSDGIPRSFVGGKRVTAGDRSIAIDDAGLDQFGVDAAKKVAELESSGFAPMNYKEVDGIGSALQFVAENIAASAPDMMVSFATGGFAPLLQISLLGGEVNQELAEKTNLSRDQRVGTAAATGVAMMLLENFGLSRIFRGMLPGDVAIDAIDGTLTKKLVSNGFSEGAARLLQAGIAEGSTEALQEALIVGVTSVSGGKYKEGEIKDRIASAFFAGAGVGVGLRASTEIPTVAGKEFVSLLSRVNKTGQTAKKLQEIDAAAQQSKLKTRLPDKFVEALESAGLADKDIYIAAEDVREYFQSRSLDESEIERWGVSTDVYLEKLASGGDVVIPVADYASLIAGTDDAVWIQENGVFDPDEMSPAQAQRFNEEAAAVFQEAFEEVTAESRRSAENASGDVQIFDSMVSELRAAGRSVDVAKNEARVWQSFWKTMAERYGDDPLEMAQKFGVRVQGPNRDLVAGRKRGDIDIMLNTLRVGKGTSQVGQSLVSFLRGLGGLRDLGGELAAMDAPKSLIAASRKDLDNRQLGFGGVPMPLAGVGLDDAARRAVEAGYFPQLTGEVSFENTNQEVDLVAPLLEAIGREIGGEPVFIPGEGVDTDLLALSDSLDELGISLDQSNDEIIAALEAAGSSQGQGDALFQDAPEGDAFRRWAGTDNILDPDEINFTDFSGDGPFVMRAYHGTTHTIEAFDASITGNKQGQFGAVNYFTSSESDARDNYAGEGPDLTSRIENEASSFYDDILDRIADEGQESVLSEFDDKEFLDAARGLDDEELATFIAKQKARERLSGGQENLIEVFIRTEKPFVVGADSPWIEFVDFSDLEQKAIERVADDNDIDVSDIEENRDDYDDQIEEARWEIQSESENPLIEAIQTVADRYGIDPSGIFESVADFQYEGGRQSDFEAALRNSEALSYAEDFENGGLIGYHIIGEIIEELGFDSIILKDAADRFKSMSIDYGTAHIHVFDSHKRNIKSVENRGTFDPDDPRILYQEKRGSIQFPRGGLADGQTVINLFESADLSTFLHESGHFFLEAFETLAKSDAATDDIVADMQTIREFLGAKDGDALTTEQHEKWARGFEVYLIEGKAPSLALADAFARFKAWLSRIYKSIAGLNVKLTPEIRDVMDRMLATEAEIREAREVAAMRPLFRDGAPPGMSEGDFRTYQRMAQRSVEQAEQRLLKRTMNKIRIEREAWFKKERAALRSEVESAINSQREYRLVEMLANKTWLGSDREVPDMQIDRKALVNMFGDGVLAEIGRNKLGGKRAIYAADGESPEFVATYFGFGSVTEMIEVLQNSGKRREVIEVETDRRMFERYGDPLNDGSIEEDAVIAIHAEQQAATVVAEARHLNREAGRPNRNTNAKVYRARARQMINDMPVRDVMRPDAFLNAERRASREAEKAFAQVSRGGRLSGEALDRAAAAKERQLINHFLFLEARQAEAEISKGREKARAYEGKKLRQKIGSGYIEQIDALLERFDFRVRGKKQIERSESLRDFVRRMTEQGREAELAISDKLLDESRKMHFTRMSVGDIRGLFDTMANIEHMGRFKGKLIEKARKRDLDNTVGSLLEAFDQNVSGKSPDRVAKKWDKLRKHGRDYLNLTLNADTLLREIDGFQDLGTAYSAIKQPIDESMSVLTERRIKMAKDLDAIYNRYSAETLRDMSVVRSVSALGGEFSKWNLIAIALNTGNVDNYQRLTNPKTKGGFTPEQVQGALQSLTDQDWQVVQEIWDYVNSFWPEIAEKETRTTGVVPKKVESKLMVDAPDFVKGGYYPIKYDPRLAGRVSEQDQQALTEALMGGRYGKAQTANGHTKERALNVTLPLKLDMSVLHNHLSQVLYDLEIGEAVTNSWRILQDGRTKDAFFDAGKKSDFEALEIWLQDVAGGDQVSARGFEVALRHLRSGFVISRLALNVSTALIQPSGLAQTAVVVGKRATARGTLNYLRNPGKWLKDVATNSAYMRERQTTFERDIFNVVGDLETGPVTGRWAKFQRDVILPLSFVMMQKVQYYAVDMPTWVSAYQKEVGKSGDHQKALLYADRMVARAQGSGLMSDRGMLERGTTDKNSRQREFPKLLTALGSYMFAKGNVAYEATMKTNFKDPVDAFKWAVDMGLLFTFEALLYSAVKGFGPEDDEDFAIWLLKETGFSVMSTAPIAREISGGLQGFGAGGILGSTLDKAFVKPAVQIGQGEYDKALVKSLVDMSGIWFHLPSSQTNAILNGLLDDDMKIRSEVDPLELVGVGVGGGNSLADYFMNGDNDR